MQKKLKETSIELEAEIRTDYEFLKKELGGTYIKSLYEVITIKPINLSEFEIKRNNKETVQLIPKGSNPLTFKIFNRITGGDD